jgi:hypothetical protein
MTELREDTEHTANGQFATKGGGDSLIGKSLGAKHDVLRTPEVHAQLKSLYKQASPTMMKGSSIHQEYSFTVDKKSGKPSKIESSGESNKNHFVKPDEPVSALIHTHPSSVLPTPGPGDPAAAALIEAPNYELSQRELWVVQPDGTQEQVGTVDWKHGDIVITPVNADVRSLPFNYSTEENPKQPLPDSSVASGSDRGVSNSVSEVPSPAGPSSDPYKRIVDFFSAPEKDDEPVGLRDNIVEMFRDAFGELGEKPTNDWNGEEMFRDATADKLTGKAVPQEDWKSLGIGYGNIAGQAFAEVNDIGPQGEPIFRFNENHDEKGKFTSGGGGSPKDQKVGDKVKDVFGNEGTVKGRHGQSGTVQVDVAGKLQYWHPSQFQRGLYVHCGPQGEILEERFNENHGEAGRFTSSGTDVSGDMKTTTYKSENHSIVVEHNTKENKITIKHLDEHGDLLVQQTHDSVGAARKELQSQGIDHKFYRALRQ